MNVRIAKPTDLAQIVSLAQEVYTQTFGDEMSEEELKLALETRSESYFNKAIETDEIFVAEIGNQIVGFIQFGVVSYEEVEAKPEDIELNKIYVDPNYHGQGIGKKLIEAMLSSKRIKPTSDIYLDVYAKNEKATSLYKKYGFVEIGKVPFKTNQKVVGYDILMKRSHRFIS